MATDYVYVSGELFGAGAYDLYSYFPGIPEAGEEDIIEIVRNFTILKADPGRARIDTAPDSDVTFSVKRNDVHIFNVNFVTTSLVGVIEFVNDVTEESVSSGDTLRIVAPSPADASIENVRIVFKTD